MPATWFIGDPHFGHERVAAIRGYAEPGLHDETILHKWRRQVSEDDVVYVLGDLSGGAPVAERRALGLLSGLPGHKRLIAGNHDSIAGIHRKPSPNTEMFREVFEQIHDYGRIRSEGKQILLSHYPYAAQGDGPGRGEARYLQFRLPDLGAHLIHAHTHHFSATSGSITGRELCVSWDAWRRLVSMGDVAKWLAESSAQGGTQ